jgi:hypothetical protein
MREIPGDPLTGQVPVTRLLIRPTRPLVRLDTWPLKPDIDSVNLRLLQPGNIALVRTRGGLKERMIRVVHASLNWRGKGRRYFIGCSKRGWCRPYWVSQIVTIEGRTR